MHVPESSFSRARPCTRSAKDLTPSSMVFEMRILSANASTKVSRSRSSCTPLVDARLCLDDCRGGILFASASSESSEESSVSGLFGKSRSSGTADAESHALRRSLRRRISAEWRSRKAKASCELADSRSSTSSSSSSITMPTSSSFSDDSRPRPRKDGASDEPLRSDLTVVENCALERPEAAKASSASKESSQCSKASSTVSKKRPRSSKARPSHDLSPCASAWHGSDSAGARLTSKWRASASATIF
mmetsp:Transcript_14758/g.44686  ORF Transcript_14758/g.44686 Transcript_14758/m.44686 type:complete len:247 (-) Transcript_14758:41-781(-)